MNEDKLEQFINQNREGFDDRVPDLKIWDQIESNLDQKSAPNKERTIPIWKMMQVAALFVLVLGVGTLIGLQLNQGQPVNSMAYQELMEAEQHYDNKIKSMMVSLQSVPSIQESQIEDDLAQLDEVYLELKQELQNNPEANTELVIDAMLRNYDTKIKILETVLNRYQSLESIKNEDDEKLEI